MILVRTFDINGNRIAIAPDKILEIIEVKGGCDILVRGATPLKLYSSESFTSLCDKVDEAMERK